MRPHDHIGWSFAGAAEFTVLAQRFLAEGAARGEKLIYVADDPGPAAAAALAGVAGTDAVQVASIADVYGASGIVDAPRQRATFASALADARAGGYTGIRVAADNTPLVADEVRLAAWIRWEIAADRFMSENPVTGLCAFDRDKIDVNRLRHLATLHPLSSAASPIPQFRVFADGGDLRAEGDIDASVIGHLRLCLEVLPPRTGVLIDLAAAALRGRKTLAGLGQLCRDGVMITVRGGPAAISELRASGLPGTERLIFRNEEPACPAEPAAWRPPASVAGAGTAGALPAR